MTGQRVAAVFFGPQGQGSFNEAGYAGAGRAKLKGHKVVSHWISPIDAEGRARELHRICSQGYDFVVAHGGQGDAPVARIHADFPKTTFTITQGSFSATNVACYEALQEQSAFLAGILAGQSSQTGVVAHISGEKVRPGLKGRAAFAHGVRASGGSCRFITHFCGNQHDPDLAYKVTRALHDSGADIIFAMIDGGREGVIRACREFDMKQIGNVLDWVERDPEVFLASAVADSGRCLEFAIEDYVSGRTDVGSVKRFGIEDESFVRLATGRDVSAACQTLLEQWRLRLISGTFVPDEDYRLEEFELAE